MLSAWEGLVLSPSSAVTEKMAIRRASETIRIRRREVFVELSSFIRHGRRTDQQGFGRLLPVRWHDASIITTSGGTAVSVW